MSSKITKISVKPRESQNPRGQNPENQNRDNQDRKTDSRETNLHDESAKNTAGKPAKISKTDKRLNKQAKTPKNQGDEKPLKSVFILARPFVALGRYLRNSWRELRMVRWPSRKATWKMTLAVLVYCAIFIVFIVLLDMLFTFIFNLIFGIN